MNENILLYSLAHFFLDYQVLIIGLAVVLGVFLIFIFYLKKALGYIDVLVESSEYLVSDEERLIRLPAPLRSAEQYMNEAKQNAIRNSRLAKESEQRKNDLIVYLAHDLKTPLTSVIGYLTLLRDEQQISPELRQKYLSISLDRAERLEDLINEFFEITRFNLSSLTLELSRVNLSRMLEQITYEFEPIFAEKNLTCTLQIPSNLMFKCDVNKLERVFDNLLRNAVNYSFENSEITIRVTQGETGICLIFQNHGNTIPPDKLNRIFEQFFRLDSARTSKTGGAGLGLAIAKEIVELHGGSITAYSKNEVIEFTVFLPKQP